MDMARPVACCYLLVALSIPFFLNFFFVRADYRFEVRAHSYSNPRGIGSNGRCCESFTSPPCSLSCDTRFTFCLRAPGASQDGSTTNCPLGRFQTSDSIGGNSFTFGQSFIEAPGVPNPMVFTGTTTWAGGFQLYIQVEDDDGIFDDHIDDIYISETLTSGRSIAQRSYTGVSGVATISLSFSLTCTRFFGPFCSSVCVPLTDPLNGRTNQPSTNNIGSMATYSCNMNYGLVGQATRTCQSSGVWSGSAPTCVFDCGDPPDSLGKFGQVHFTSTTEGSEAMYSCNVGYVLIGPPPSPQSITCLSNGWTTVVAMCVMDCPNLPEPANGEISYTPFPSTTSTRASATYSCDLGHTLVNGDITLSCQPSQGRWLGTPPTCEPGCGSLNNPENGQVFHLTTSVGSMARYSCNVGFGLVGGVTRTCTLTGWSGTAPTCEFDCGPLMDPLNGRVQVSATTLQSIATYNCNTGYGIAGSNTRTCLFGGWSNTPPTCAVDCGNLRAPSNGRVHDSSTVEGSRVMYSCFSGYDLVGDFTRTCQSNGRWSGSTPTCHGNNDDSQTDGNISDATIGIIVGVVLAIVFFIIPAICCFCCYCVCPVCSAILGDDSCEKNWCCVTDCLCSFMGDSCSKLRDCLCNDCCNNALDCKGY